MPQIESELVHIENPNTHTRNWPLGVTCTCGWKYKLLASSFADDILFRCMPHGAAL